MLDLIKTYIKKDDGATAIEYGLIAGAVAVALVAAMAIFGPEIEGLFQGLSDSLSDNTPGGGGGGT